MHNSYLAIGRVCYWQDGGWHGCNIIVKLSIRFVYFKTYQNGKITDPTKTTRYSKKRFLATHEVFPNACTYGSYHINIGNIVPCPNN